MTTSEALLRRPAATGIDLKNLLDLILLDQVNPHKLNAQIQASLTDEEFDADVLAAIEYDERICALRMYVRFSTSQASSASPVPLPQGVMFSSAIVTSALCSVFEEAQTTAPRRATGDVPPVEAKPIERVIKHDGEGTAQEKDAEQDPGVPTQGEGLQQLPIPGVTTAHISEKPHLLCHDPDVADAIPASETSPRLCCDHSIGDAVTVLEMSQLPCGDPGVTGATADLQTCQQPCCDAKIISLDRATKTWLVPNLGKLQGMAKRLLLRRSVNELRRCRRSATARIQAWRRGNRAVKQTSCFDAGYAFFGKHESKLDVPFYRVYQPDETEVPWSAEKTHMLLVHTDYFAEHGSDADTTIVPLRSPHALWQLGRPHQLFPFDPGGCLVENAGARSLFHGHQQSILNIWFHPA